MSKEPTTRSIITIELDREVDGRWIAEIPAIPGCLAYGSTQAYAKSNVLALASSIMCEAETEFLLRAAEEGAHL